MYRIKHCILWVLGVVSIFFISASMSPVEASYTKSVQWPATMLVQEGTSQSIISSGVAQSLEEGLRQIGIETTASYMIMNKRNNNYYYARYGEGTLLYGFGPQKAVLQPEKFSTGFKHAVTMIQEYQAYMQEHPESFTVVVPFHEVKNNVYVGEMIVNTWFKQVVYPMYIQIAFVGDSSTGAPRLRYIMTHVKDDMMRQQLKDVL